ncbi:MAG: cytidylate kinase family protein [Candidatus Rokuibacteriota bacterium]
MTRSGGSSHGPSATGSRTGEIILQAAERFGTGVREFEHATEERPSLWERLSDTKRRYVTYVEAVIFELVVQGDIVLSGRGAPFSLQRVRHVLRVRVTAPESLRAERLGLGIDAGTDLVRHSDRERASRVKFLYNVDWDAPLLYDLVLNTERLDVPGSVRLIRQALEQGRFQSTPDSLATARDLGLAARARAALLLDPLTQDLQVAITCENGVVSMSGRVAQREQRAVVEETIGRFPGVTKVLSDITVLPPPGIGV